MNTILTWLGYVTVKKEWKIIAKPEWNIDIHICFFFNTASPYKCNVIWFFFYHYLDRLILSLSKFTRSFTLLHYGDRCKKKKKRVGLFTFTWKGLTDFTEPVQKWETHSSVILLTIKKLNFSMYGCHM